ncbi:carboxylesterase family protein-like protein [Aureobasidium sp. EXF-3400]|nr:carboxylesterase family protein-like protein [Aureobasidium sp. EXF-12344]KAI4769677.1 carboxylesterase family protein-like protein [Aureobasidium sp. EXF-3400]
MNEFPDTLKATGGYYSFSNIRYAAPPVGDLRFAAPQAPAVDRSQLQTGSVNRICPQANPAWEIIAGQWIPEYLLENKTSFTMSDFNLTIPSSNSSAATATGETEDCLFLDVVVPEGIFNSNKQHPVLVWIYGGGYTAGSKSGSGNPAGLLERSQLDNSSGVIYVAMNYRLGAMGWLSGPTFQENATANAGLYDQRFALDWVQQNIHLFGGDPKNVTVFGESAGGGSIMHQITAFGGLKGPAPFAGAVPQSPGFFPIVSASAQEAVFDNFLALLNVSTLAEARKLPSSAIIAANAKQVGGAPYGQFVYGPTVDGDFVPALPGQLLARGQFDKNISVMTGHNANEGLLFTSPFIDNNTALDAFLLTSFPALTYMPATLKYITQVLYPPIFDGSQAQNYTNQIGRVEAILSEFSFTCNAVWLNKAYNNETHAYLFDVPPSLHGQDIAYTYYNGNGSTTAGTGGTSFGVQNVPVAIAMQEFITEFAKTGNPNSRGLPFFPMYGSNATVLALGPRTISPMRDPAASARCAWWQKGLFY